MSSFIRSVATSSVAGTLSTATLLVNGAPAAMIGKSPQSIGSCGPTLPPQAYCPPDKVALCRKTKSVVRRGKTFTCCARWDCVRRGWLRTLLPVKG